MPSILAYFYDGARINTAPARSCRPASVAQVFNWYNAREPGSLLRRHAGRGHRASTDRSSRRTPMKSRSASPVSSAPRLGPRGLRQPDVRQLLRRPDRCVDRVVFDEFGQPYDLKLIGNTNELTRDVPARSTYRAPTASGTLPRRQLHAVRTARQCQRRDQRVGPRRGRHPQLSGVLPAQLAVPDGRPARRPAASGPRLGHLRAALARGLGACRSARSSRSQSGTPYGAAGRCSSPRSRTIPATRCRPIRRLLLHGA